MYMAYSNSPERPRVRRDAVRKVREGWSTRKVARYFGFSHSAIVKWVARAPQDARKVIPTLSSRPHRHPSELKPEIVDQVVAYRRRYIRDAFFIHHLLLKDGIEVSLSSVKRTLRREGLTRFSPQKKWHQYPPRPLPEKPGMLVEVDTIVMGAPEERLYCYTLIDVCSRWAHAIAVPRIDTHRSLRFVEAAQTISPFDFHTLQSDHGPEFSKWFTKRILERGMAHRHSRIRTPNDNAHLERFNRTIQDECLSRIPRNLRLWARELPEYLRYYNTERPHMALGMKTPQEIIKSVPSY